MTSVSRAMVLEAAAGLRAVDPDAAAEARLDRLVRDIIAGTVPTAGDDLVDYTAYPTSGTTSVTGVLIDVSLTRTDTVQTRSLATVALAPTADDVQLEGSVVVTGLPIDAEDGGRTLQTSALSGDVHVSAPVDVSDSGVLRVALTSVTVDPTPEPAPAAPAPPPTSTPRTAAELLAARRTYDAALKKARATYAKARKKAKKSKRKRVAAKKAYDKRRARAKAVYRAAVADRPASATPQAAPPAAAAPTASGSTIISTDVGWAAIA